MGEVRDRLIDIVPQAPHPNPAAKPLLSKNVIAELAATGLKSLESLGQQAGADARSEILRILEEEGVSVRKVARRLAEALDADRVEAKLKKDGEFAYSDPLTDNRIRLDAVKLGAEILEMKEPEDRGKTQVIIVDSFNAGSPGAPGTSSAHPTQRQPVIIEADHRTVDRTLDDDDGKLGSPDTYRGADLPLPAAPPGSGSQPGKD